MKCASNDPVLPVLEYLNVLGRYVPLLPQVRQPLWSVGGKQEEEKIPSLPSLTSESNQTVRKIMI